MKILVEAADIDFAIVEAIEETLGWFDDAPRLKTEEFIDRLCDIYGGDNWDIENYSTPAVKRIMKIARDLRSYQ